MEMTMEKTMEKTQSNKNRKKLLAVIAAGALGVGMVGVGANWDHVTSIVDNRFSATAPGSDIDDIGGALLTVAGAPIDHVFDTTKYNQFVDATWTVTNKGGDAAQYAASFETRGDISPNLAQNLQVRYGVTDASGQVTSWVAAGTLAEPVEFTAALGLASAIEGNASIQVPVRILLEDPTVLEGDAGDEHRVTADFVVSYMNPA
ncbi:hypothetical protein A9Z40_01745 [Microbacterium arborescens]|uniref:Uncharacterized protein n=2 Tax=Microbacterium arborescens TaxID=33883 RepID=A0ABX2WJQ9_9MICO|nr:hypothetical protein A9Z40_01745 [Microbacterium arborescens]